MRRKIVISLVAASTMLFSCGKKDKDNGDDADTSTSVTGTGGGTGGTTVTAPELTSPKKVVGYALTALSSAAPKASASLALDDAQSTDFPNCSENGAPWDTALGARMQPSNPAFARQTFECQLSANNSSESIRGAFEQNYRILCQLDKALGDIVYTAEGKSYDTKIAISTDCGWSQKTIDEVSSQVGAEGFPATVTATALTTGDWQKKIVMSSEMVNFTMYMTATSTTVAFKQVEKWTQKERDGGDQNSSLPADAEGLQGGIVSLDMTNGVLRAELGDPYWSRRARMIVKGSIDGATGAFTNITEGSGLQGNFSQSSYEGKSNLYGEVASFKGTAAGGFMYRNAQYQCDVDAGCTLATDVRSKAKITTAGSGCNPSTSCAAETGIALGTEAADYDFWMIGKSWDAQGGTAAAWTTWLESAGLLTFTEADKSPALK